MEDKVIQSQKRNLIIAIAIAFLLLVFNVFQLTQNDFVSVKKKDFRQKNEQLVLAVDAAKVEVNRYKGISSKLDKVVKEANVKILEQEQKIKKLLNSNSSLKNENKEYSEQISEIKEKYLQTIDSLLLADGLNMALENAIENLEDEINKLNLKLGIASQFVADNVVVSPLKERLSGEFKETAMAKHTKAIRICFDIAENKITKKGNYQIYMRVLSPDARVLYNVNEGRYGCKTSFN